ncbi:PREDICTED: uncharacterized protein LOC18606844 [Theobroma cacao]|uniref:Uncharacterized protein LOC18606844 n=1 Tax=Theobroma cacao TaxID=3641 RepID=A0AB32VD20_THECC|nr:PREDICTED: uncharacterized protein LOC18606844 [Theobroma cacao]
MSSSKGDSVQHTDAAATISIQSIIDKLTDLRKLLDEKVIKGDVPDRGSQEGGIKLAPSEDGQAKLNTDLEKVCKELDYMIRAFDKLKKFEGDLKEPLKTLDNNVNDILKDLEVLKSSSGSLKQIQQNLKVLRSNITKVKIQIPLQHQASNLISDASRYLQATVASREEGDLPNLYEAANILEIKGSFYEEIQDKYNGLDKKALKMCLLCFAIFPENAEIKKSLLRFWWFGERLMENPIVTGEKENMDRVNDVLGELIKKGFIEPVEKKSRLPATRYKMHPIVRSLLIKLAKEANFFDYDAKGIPTMDVSASEKSCLIKSEGHSHWFSKNPFQEGEEQKINPGDQQKTNSKGRQQKNSKKQQQTNQEKQQPTSSENQQKTYQENQRKQKELLKNLEELQTLFNISKQFPDLPEEKFSKIKGVRVLYLGRWESTAERHMEVESTEFLKGLEKMKELRFFSLQGISGISTLPKSLGKLINLRILDLRACHNLEELPKELGLLKKLTYLDMSECYLIDNMPKQLTSLSELQVLKGFVISKNRHSCTFGNLTTLSKLKKLTINVNSDEFSIDKAEGDLYRFQALRKLRIAWGAGSSKSIDGNKEEKKGNGNQETNGNKRKFYKRQQNDAAKSMLSNLKMPWGACGEGTSKSVAEKKVTATTEKSTLEGKDEIRKIDYGKQESSEGEKQGSDAAKSGAKNLNDNKDAGKQKTEEAISLEKLDLQCFPRPEPPSWLVPEKLESLKSLYIRGGRLSYLGEPKGSKKWEVETLRLKYLTGVQINWKDLQTQFPKLTYLERVNCPGITFCPCDANGVWRNLEKEK